MSRANDPNSKVEYPCFSCKYFKYQHGPLPEMVIPNCKKKILDTLLGLPDSCSSYKPTMWTIIKNKVKSLLDK